MSVKKQKLIIILLLAAVLIPGFAGAQSITDIFTDPVGVIGGSILGIVGKAVAIVIYYINYIIAFIGGIIFAIGGLLIQMGLELNARLIVSPIVRTGWLITRDFANLGFVIAIVVMAFATMLRMQTYGAKKMLTSLIVMALLVNFSLSIAGIMIDASGIVSNFFSQKVAPQSLGGVSRFAETLASAFQVQKLYEIKDMTQIPDFNGSVEKFSAAMLGLVASLFFVAVFTVISGVTMLAIAVLVLIRYIALSILLILMPIVWVFSIFPDFKKWWTQWWNKFLEWLFFLPAALFFVYLTVLVVTNFKNDPNSLLQAAASVGATSGGFMETFLLLIKDTFQIIAQMILVIGLLIGGLIAAKSASGFGAESVMKTAERVKGWGLGKIGGLAKAPVGWTGEKIARSATVSKTVDWMAKTPGLRGAGAALSNYLAKGKETVEEYQKKNLENISNDAVKNWHEWGPIAQAAKINELAKRGLLDEHLNNIQNPAERDRQLDKYVKVAKQMGTSKDLLKVRPDLAEKFGETIDKIVGKISPKDAANISKESLQKIEVAAALQINQLKEIGRKGTPEVKKIIEDAIGKKITALSGKAVVGKLTPEEQSFYNKIAKLDDFIKNNPAWA